MAREEIVARFQVKDENGNAVMQDGQPVWKEFKGEYDFGDNLDSAVEMFGSDVVFSNFKANGRVAIQGIIRAKLKAGQTDEQIQELLNGYKLGVVLEKTAVDPVQAVKAAFATWSPEKQKEYLKSLGVEIG